MIKKILDFLSLKITAVIVMILLIVVNIWQTHRVDLQYRLLKPLQLKYMHGNVEYLNPRIVHELYQLLKDVTEILDKHHIKYWAVGGTLIGSVRHKGFIPWDHDLDIGILEEDKKKVLELHEEFGALNYDITFSDGIIKIFPQTGITENNWKYPFIDIFPYKIENKYYIHSEPIAQKVWPKDIYPVADIEYLVKCPFGDITIMCPNNALMIIKEFYGANVMTHGFAVPEHLYINDLGKQEWELRPWEYKAAPHSKLIDRVK